jgi:hypothetical protein
MAAASSDLAGEVSHLQAVANNAIAERFQALGEESHVIGDRTQTIGVEANTIADKTDIHVENNVLSGLNNMM